MAFSATNGTASAADFALSTATPLTFSGTAGETKNIAVTIKGDQIVEGNETFTVTLGTVTPLGSRAAEQHRDGRLGDRARSTTMIRPR